MYKTIIAIVLCMLLQACGDNANINKHSSLSYGDGTTEIKSVEVPEILNRNIKATDMIYPIKEKGRLAKIFLGKVVKVKNNKYTTIVTDYGEFLCVITGDTAEFPAKGTMTWLNVYDTGVGYVCWTGSDACWAAEIDSRL